MGIPLCLDDRGRWRAGRRYHYIDAAYAEALTRAGAVASYLPAGADVAVLLDGIDGLLVPGGDDLPPPAPIAGAQLDLVPDEQLAFDRALLEGALARELPVLGICYGMQLLALACGGELHYHLPTDLPAAGPHRLPEPDGRHALRVEEGSRLASLLGGAEPVNSLHHQGVATPGSLRACAWADDGVIEAVEGTGPSFCVGVQWHPEKLPAASSDRLFAAFVATCGERVSADPAGPRDGSAR